jgi:hypothetical protein
MSHTLRQTLARLVAVTALGVLSALPAPASAATTIGQVDPAAAPSGYCTGNSGWVQSAQSGAGSYVVPAGGGVITSWSHKANANAGKQVALRVYRATGTPGTYVVAGITSLQTLAPSTLNTFPAQVSVAAGDLIGLRTGNAPVFPDVIGGGASCTFTAPAGNTVRSALNTAEPAVGGSGAMPASYTLSRVNVSAKLEADADLDGFGDETQDQCPGLGGPNGGCGGPGGTTGTDTTAPSAKLRARRQAIKGGKVQFSVTPSESVTLTVTGTVSVPGAAKAHRLRKVTRTASAGKSLTVRMTLKQATRRAVKRTLRRGKHPRVRITIALRDAAGNAATVKGTVKLKRR